MYTLSHNRLLQQTQSILVSHLTRSLVSVIMLSAASSSYALDARAIAMGGTGVTTGVGINGVMQNPALLMQQKNQHQKFSLRFGIAADIQDSHDLASALDDGDNLTNSLQQEINTLEQKKIPTLCNELNPNGSFVCMTGVSKFRNLSQQSLDLMNKVDGKPIDLGVNTDLGFAVPQATYPFAVNMHVSGTFSAMPTISATDRAYIQSFINHNGAVDDYTVQDLKDNPNINVIGTSVTIKQPDDVLNSSIDGAALIRSELALSTAHTFDINQLPVNIGITPKFARLIAANVSQKINDTGTNVSIQDQIDANQVSKTAFTFDLGATVNSPKVNGLVFGAVLKNALSESIATPTGYTFETTPQLIGSVGFERAFETTGYKLSADLALNKAKQDNLESQSLGLGAEFNWRYFGIRAGLAHDFAIDASPNSYSLGLDLGFLEIGARYNSATSAQVGIQMAVAF